MGYLLCKKLDIPDQENDTYIDNRWVVLYNSYLLKNFNVHINLEVCYFIKAITYLYKYVYKGHDSVYISVLLQFKKNNDKTTEIYMSK